MREDRDFERFGEGPTRIIHPLVGERLLTELARVSQQIRAKS